MYKELVEEAVIYEIEHLESRMRDLITFEFEESKIYFRSDWKENYIFQTFDEALLAVYNEIPKSYFTSDNLAEEDTEIILYYNLADEETEIEVIQVRDQLMELHERTKLVGDDCENKAEKALYLKLKEKYEVS